ncbi:MAG: GNAT family N-acetyltransferase [Bacteroidia bacterium]
MNIQLRAWHLNDLENLVKYANNPNIAQFMTDGFLHPYTEEKGRAFIEMASQGEPTRIFAIEVEGKAVGSIGIYPQGDIQRKNAELGYWLAQEFWGKGIATQAVKQITEIAFQILPIYRLFARPFGTNIGSQRVLEKAGFVFEARIEKGFFKNGELIDELIYAIRREQP